MSRKKIQKLFYKIKNFYLGFFRLNVFKIIIFVKFEIILENHLFFHKNM